MAERAGERFLGASGSLREPSAGQSGGWQPRASAAVPAGKRGVRQFCDHGNQYRTAIFVHDEAQKKAAEASKAALEAAKKLPGPIQTQIVPFTTFWPAEGYHQDYYLKNPVRYKYYRYNCGRDKRLEELWGADAGGH